MFLIRQPAGTYIRYLVKQSKEYDLIMSNKYIHAHLRCQLVKSDLPEEL